MWCVVCGVCGVCGVSDAFSMWCSVCEVHIMEKEKQGGTRILQLTCTANYLAKVGKTAVNS